MALLETHKLLKHFGGLTAVSNVDLSVDKGQILGLIGPNGAGKTTTFNLISGILHPSGGRVVFNGKDITGHKPHALARMGMARTFQLTNLFKDLSVLENVQVAYHYRSGVGFWRTVLETPGMARRQNREVFEKAMALLRLVGLSEVADQPAQSLPGGHQKIMSLAIALATEPELLLLDEPVRGLNAEEIARFMKLIKTLRDERATGIIVVEHNMRVIMEECDYVVVLNHGEKIAEGLPAQIAENRTVIEAYLGGNVGAA